MSEKFKDNKFAVMAGGKEIVCDILFTFHSQETGKHYMSFTDHSKDRNGNVNVFYATYNPDSENVDLVPIQTQQEWTMMRELMSGLGEDAQKELVEKLRAAMAPQEEEPAAQE